MAFCVDNGNVHLFCMIFMFIFLIGTSRCQVVQRTQLLTPSIATINGAQVIADIQSVQNVNNEWNVAIRFQATWQFILMLDKTWAFDSLRTSIRITINSPLPTTIFDGLLFGFTTDNLQYFSMWIAMDNQAQKNKIYPACGTDTTPIQTFGQGDIASLPNRDSFNWKTMLPKNTQSTNVSKHNNFPIQVILENNPIANTLIVKFGTHKCTLVSLSTNKGLKIYIGANGNVPRHKLIISSFEIKSSTYAYTTKYTTHAPKFIPAPIYNPTINTSIIHIIQPTTFPIKIPTYNPTHIPITLPTQNYKASINSANERINIYKQLQHKNKHKIKNTYDKIWPSPCDLQPAINMQFCNYSLSFQQRAQSLLDAMTINETLSQTSCWSGPVPRLNISFYNWWVDAAHGLGQHVHFDCFPTKTATSFPQTINSGATFNRTLWWKIGDIISTEARAFANYGCSSLTFWDPNINILRDPRWGRAQEVPGEDPFVNAEYAINFVKGMQGNDSKYLKASVTCKHFDAYSLEGSWGRGPTNKINRHTFNAIISDYDFNDTYYPAFKYCVSSASDHGQASGVMCSYNQVNGIPSCANKELLTSRLNELGFDGYIVSDCWAVKHVQSTHHYTVTPAQTINAVYKAGMNLECSNFIELNAWTAIQEGSVDFELIKNRTVNAIKVQMRLGYYDPADNTPWSTYDQTMVNTVYNQQVALDGARQSTVLLKNVNNSYLPIKPSDLKTINIAVLGPHANESDVLLGNYQGVPPFIVTVLQAIQSYVSVVNYNMGCHINSNNNINFSESMQLASSADVTILVMGLDDTIEAEGKDRHSLYLPGIQNEFIRNICSVTSDVILVLINAGCVDVSEFETNDNIAAILWAGYPGMYGGQGVADVIFGRFAPTGLNSQTWYLGDYVNEVSMTNMNMRPHTNINSSVNYTYPGRGYRYYNGQNVLYPFGFGLSYTTFVCTNLNVQNSVSSVMVKNTGNVNSGGVVLLYWIPNKYDVTGPIRRLVGFQRFNMLNIGRQINVNMNLYQEFYYSYEYQDNLGYFKLGGVCQGTADSLKTDAQY